jgi:class 3 adenylate cyclase/predicted ATPase
MQQIMDWLEKLGMAEYAQRFAENGISFAALRHLTDQDLKEIGVLLGHRRIMLAAIAELARAAESAAQPVVGLEVRPPDGAERRQVTVMFSDLVGSTALSARMDPEDLREVISAYQNCVADIVRRFDGFVAKYMGDGVLVYFGYPQAHEDDAERAVRAGLEAIAAVGGLKSSVPLQTRIGIATGLVVVGDLIGSGEAQERGIVGETPNLAARLQGIAEPNAVVIAESTRRLLGNLFELQDLGTKDLKGIAGPVPVWTALRPSLVEGRFEALHAGGLTELIGRQEEFELLLRRWSTAKTGEGQVVLLSGEAGIGKSRLTAALLERLAHEPHTRLRYFCSPQHTDSALYPIVGQMERAAGLAHDDTPRMKLDKLCAVLAQTSTSIEDAALFAEMLSLPNDGRYPALELTPQQRRQKTLEALISQLKALTRRNPVLMIFEDAHWADPTSLEAFGWVVDVIATLPVQLIVTFRPEFEAPWIGRPHVAALTLNRLTQRDVVAMIDRVIGSAPLPSGIRQDIIERTDGIPLFVEEMTKAVLEAESESEARRTAAAVPSLATAVPASLLASLMARLDRLGPAAKEVAQTGAAIGREFSHALLAVVMHKPHAELRSALDRLIAAGLLFRRGVPPYATYLFKHALVQDAAYGTLLREPRRALHARIAQTLEGQFAEIAESQPELLARHCTEAGQIEKAAGLWGKAGQRSLGRSALVEAVAQLTRALDQIATLPATPVLRRDQIKFQVALANALMHVKGYAAPETKTSLHQARLYIERAEAFGEPLEDPLALFSVLYGFWVANVTSFDGDAARELAMEFLTLAERQGSTAPRVIGHRLMGRTLIDTGNIVEGCRHCDQALALYDPEHRPLAMRFGQDTEVSVLSFRPLGLWLLGYPARAVADTSQAMKRAREIGQVATLMFTLAHTPLPLVLSGDYATASHHADEVVALADEKGAPLWKAIGTILQGILMGLTGDPAGAVQRIASGITAFREVGSKLDIPFYLCHLAKAHAELGQLDDAWRCIDEATKAIETTKERWSEAEVHRTAGEMSLILAERDAAKAEAYFERALSVARAQEAKSWELRAATSLARLWRDQGKRQQARELLAPVYGWFAEGFDTRDLKEAKALLDGLHD